MSSADADDVVLRPRDKWTTLQLNDYQISISTNSRSRFDGKICFLSDSEDSLSPRQMCEVEVLGEGEGGGDVLLFCVYPSCTGSSCDVEQEHGDFRNTRGSLLFGSYVIRPLICSLNKSPPLWIDVEYVGTWTGTRMLVSRRFTMFRASPCKNNYKWRRWGRRRVVLASERVLSYGGR